jgi:hypothetical protein
MEKHLQAARHIGEILKGYPNVELLIIGGSVALGYENEDSDVDMHAFCNKLPSENELKQIFKNYKISISNKIDFLYLEVKLNVDTSIEFYDIAYIKDPISKYPDLKLREYTRLVTLILNAILVFDKTNNFKKWKKDISKFPQHLIHQVMDLNYKRIKHNLKYQLLKYSEKNNMIRLHLTLDKLINDLILIIYVLNNTLIDYDYPLLANERLKDFAIKPPNLLKIINKIIKMGNSKKEINKKVELFGGLINWLEPYINDIQTKAFRPNIFSY